MRFKDKVENSVVVSEYIEDRYFSNIYGPKAKKKQLISLLILTCYSIINNIIIKDLNLMIISSLVFLISLVCSIIIGLMSNTFFEKHYPGFAKLVVFIKSVCKILLVFFNILSVLAINSEYLKIMISLVKNIDARNWEMALTDVMSIGFNTEFYMLIINLISLPFLLVIFILKYILYLPPLGIFRYLIWLFYNNRIFYQYTNSQSSKFTKKYKREINKEAQPYLEAFVKKILISLSFVFFFELFFTGLYFIYYKNVSEMLIESINNIKNSL